MASKEIIKLVGIIVGGIIIAVIGEFIIIRKRRKSQEDLKDLDYQNISVDTNNSISAEEKSAKNYILQYKEQYPIESIKAGLINMGISESNAQSYVNRYY